MVELGTEATGYVRVGGADRGAQEGVGVLARDADDTNRGMAGEFRERLAKKNGLVVAEVRPGTEKRLKLAECVIKQGEIGKVRRADVERLGVGGGEKPGPEERGEEIADLQGSCA